MHGVDGRDFTPQRLHYKRGHGVADVAAHVLAHWDHRPASGKTALPVGHLCCQSSQTAAKDAFAMGALHGWRSPGPLSPAPLASPPCFSRRRRCDCPLWETFRVTTTFVVGDTWEEAHDAGARFRYLEMYEMPDDVGVGCRRTLRIRRIWHACALRILTPFEKFLRALHQGDRTLCLPVDVYIFRPLLSDAGADITPYIRLDRISVTDSSNT